MLGRCAGAIHTRRTLLLASDVGKSCRRRLPNRLVELAPRHVYPAIEAVRLEDTALELGSLLGLARMGTIPVTIALVVDQATGGHGWNLVTKAVTDEATAQGGNPRLVNGQWVGADGMPVANQGYWRRLFEGGFIDQRGVRRRTGRTPARPLDREDRNLRAKQDAETRKPRRESGPGDVVRAAGRTLLDIQLDRARAEETAGTSDDLRFAREERERYARQIRNLEERDSLTQKQKQRLRELYGQQAGVQSQIDAIVEAGEQKLADQRAAAAAKRTAARERAAARAEAAEQREEQRMAAIRESAAKRAEARADLFAKGGLGQANTRAELRRAALRGVGATVKGLKDKEDPQEEMRRLFKQMSFEFLQSLQGITNQYAGNLLPGAPNPELFSLVTLAREQNYMIAGLASGLRNPGTKYAGTEIAHMFDGPTF